MPKTLVDFKGIKIQSSNKHIEGEMEPGYLYLVNNEEIPFTAAVRQDILNAASAYASGNNRADTILLEEESDGTGRLIFTNSHGEQTILRASYIPDNVSISLNENEKLIVKPEYRQAITNEINASTTTVQNNLNSAVSILQGQDTALQNNINASNTEINKKIEGIAIDGNSATVTDHVASLNLTDKYIGQNAVTLSNPTYADLRNNTSSIIRITNGSNISSYLSISPAFDGICLRLKGTSASTYQTFLIFNQNNFARAISPNGSTFLVEKMADKKDAFEFTSIISGTEMHNNGRHRIFTVSENVTNEAFLPFVGFRGTLFQLRADNINIPALSQNTDLATYIAVSKDGRLFTLTQASNQMEGNYVPSGGWKEYSTISQLNSSISSLNINTKVDKSTTIAGIDLQDNISVSELKTAIGLATSLSEGLMSNIDKTRLDTIYTSFTGTDGNSVVDKISEILQAFENYPESSNLVSDLASAVHKTGDESISGIKTFNTRPMISTSSFTSGNQAVGKTDLDSALSPKLDKVTSGSIARAYGVNSSNSQTMFEVATSVTNNSILSRTATGQGKFNAAVNNDEAVVLSQLNSIISTINTTIAGKVSSQANSTYSNLVNMIASNQLIPGQQYLITDYKTIYVDNRIDKGDATYFGGNVITDASIEPLVVTAISSNKISNLAVSTLNQKDIIFYDVENDQNKYSWAAASGRGVIYRRIDENNNDLPYDFKQIKINVLEIDLDNILEYDDETTYNDGAVVKIQESSNVFDIYFCATQNIEFSSSYYEHPSGSKKWFKFRSIDLNNKSSHKYLQYSETKSLTTSSAVYPGYFVVYTYSYLNGEFNIEIPVKNASTRVYTFISDNDIIDNSSAFHIRNNKLGSYYIDDTNSKTKILNNVIFAGNKIKDNVFLTNVNSCFFAGDVINNKINSATNMNIFGMINNVIENYAEDIYVYNLENNNIYSNYFKMIYVNNFIYNNIRGKNFMKVMSCSTGYISENDFSSEVLEIFVGGYMSYNTFNGYMVQGNYFAGNVFYNTFSKGIAGCQLGSDFNNNNIDSFLSSCNILADSFGYNNIKSGSPISGLSFVDSFELFGKTYTHEIRMAATGNLMVTYYDEEEELVHMVITALDMPA